MVQVTLYRNPEQQYDILILDAGQYISPVVFDTIVNYLKSHFNKSIQELMPTEPKHISPCHKYHGIAIQLKGQLLFKKIVKQELETILQDAVDTLLS